MAHPTPEQLLENALAAQRLGRIADAKRLYAAVLRIDPTNAAAHGNLAIIAVQQGDLVSAERLFRRGIELRPNDALSFNNLGLVLLQQGRPIEAVSAHRRAVELKPAYAEAHFALGNAFKQQGAVSDAIASYRNAIAAKPGYAEAHNNIGVVLQSQGKLEEAAAAYNDALALQPTYAEARFNLGVALHEQRELDQAATAYRQVIKISPEAAVAHNNLGTVLQDQGHLNEAIEAFEEAIGLQADYAEAHFNRGVALQQQGKLEAAVAAYKEALRLRENYLDAFNNLGIVLQRLGRMTDAIGMYAGLLQAVPNHVDALNNMGTALFTEGRFEEALAAFQKALTLKPEFPEALFNLGNAWRELGNLGEAMSAYRSSVQLRPDDADAFSQLVYHRWRACDWDGYEADQAKLVDMVRSGARVPPFYLLSTPASPADQLASARQWIKPLIPEPSPQKISFDAAVYAKHERIRIGYLSSDFHQHATAHLMAELFELHDRRRFEIIAYSYGGNDNSPMRRRLGLAFDNFVDIQSMPHREAAEQIRRDEIDILVDLKGYTHRSRPAIAAHRAAPIQVNYLGYPATMGADFIDYVIIDEFVVPADQQPYFSEKLVHIPGCYQVNDRKREIAESAPSKTDCGLPSEGTVFCSFNNSYKITPVFFDIWMRLLKATPGSVLWLLQANPIAKDNLRREAGRRAVSPDRLIFAPYVSPAQHLARHRHADLFLDSLPCNAHTTASDALWAGLPVLTCTGNTFAGRVAGSLLTAIGLPELVATSLEEYEQAALALAGDSRRLAELRGTLRKNRDTTSLFDLPTFAEKIEAAYERMWTTWRAGQKPAAFSVDG